jgi:hypothetical protein
MAEEKASVKRSVRLGLILGVIAVIVVGIVLLRNNPQTDPATVGEDTGESAGRENSALIGLPVDGITRVEIRNREGEVRLVRDAEDTFVPDYDHDVPFATTRVQRAVLALVTLRSLRRIGDVDTVGEFGLDVPDATVSVHGQGGRTRVLHVGHPTPDREAYYVRRAGETIVYTAPKPFVEPAFWSLSDFRRRSLPPVAMDDLVELTIETPDARTIRIERRDRSGRDDGRHLTSLVVVSPFEGRFDINTNWYERFKSQLSSVNIARFVDDAPTDLGPYGLASPEARVVLRDPVGALTIDLGHRTDGGRFARLGTGAGVVVLSGIEPLVSVNPMDTLMPFVLLVDVRRVMQLQVDGPDGSYTLRIRRPVGEDAGGNDGSGKTYLLNGEAIEEDIFLELYQRAAGLRFDAEAGDMEAVDELGSPIAEISYSVNDRTQPLTVRFHPHDSSSVVTERNGVVQFVMGRSKLDRLFEAFRSAAGS